METALYQPSLEVRKIMSRHFRGNPSGDAFIKIVRLAQIELIRHYMPGMDAATRERANNTLRAIQ